MKLRPNWTKTIRSRMPSLGLVLSLCLLLASPHLMAAPKSDLWPFWDKSDEQSQHEIGHERWTSILNSHWSHDEQGNALVDYAALKADDAERLRAYIDGLTAIDPRALNRAEQMAYWINLYNALTVQLVIDAYPVDSIKKIKGGFFNTGPWDEKVTTVAGKKLTLNDIEHRILRPIWQDKRIHYAVNCASIGCPNLAPKAYSADALEQQLDEAAKTFINQSKGVAVLGEGHFRLSSIYDWYAADFGTEAELFQHLQTYHASQLLAGGNRPEDIDYDYDWRLNDISR